MTIDGKTTAYHEAGHAVVAHFLGRTPLLVQIEHCLDEEAMGQSWSFSLTSLGRDKSAEDVGIDITVLMAGVAAEERLNGSWDVRVARFDYERAVPFAKKWVQYKDAEELPEGLVEELEKHPVKIPDENKGEDAEAIRDFIKQWGQSAWEYIARDDVWVCVEAVAEKLLKSGVVVDVERIVEKTL